MNIENNVLITGGAGFIGSNLANRLISQGLQVTIFDNLTRPGCENNISWLKETHSPDAFRIVNASVGDFNALKIATEGVGRIYHLAGQVAVTSSVVNPRQDFMDNALGTFNVLEAARINGDDPILLYASTNKVYGGMESVGVIEEGSRYRYTELPHGISEDQPLDFHSPYGCSKGTGDQYTRDYARIYGLRSVVFRQSCIYGYRQFGIEDQGWVAWFIIAVLTNKPISIYGNGKQVRDLLFIDDLLDAYDKAVENINISAGQIYNIGGGLENTMSVWAEFGPLLSELAGYPVQVQFKDWRPGDQPIYVSSIQKAVRELGWSPKVSVNDGIRCLFNWVKENIRLFQ